MPPSNIKRGRAGVGSKGVIPTTAADLEALTETMMMMMMTMMMMMKIKNEDQENGSDDEVPPSHIKRWWRAGVGSKGVIPTTAADLEAALEMGMDWSLREG
jgi:hypothetical protein